MFCKKCGNSLFDGALFCQKCGAKVNEGSTANASPAYIVPTLAPAATKPPFPLKYIIIPTAVLAIAAIIIAAIVASGRPAETANGENGYIQQIGINSGFTGGTNNDTGGANNSVSLTMAVNGESLNNDLSYFCPADGGYAIGVYGTGSGSVQAASIEVGLPVSEIEPNKTYTEVSVVVGIISGNQVNNFTNQNISNLNVIAGDYRENQELVVKITGTINFNGTSVNFAARGTVSYKSTSDAQSALSTWQSGLVNSGGTGNNGGNNYANACPDCGGSGYCSICGGSGICSICHGRGGLSVPTYGQGGDDWVVCDGCKGNRGCPYCKGGICSSCGGAGHF